jgi:homoserine dehydrogenase
MSHRPATLSAPVPIVLLGWGPVARAFADAVGGPDPSARAVDGVSLMLVAIRRRDLEARVEPGASLSELSWVPAGSLPELLAASRPRVVVQAIPSSPTMADLALAQIADAFAAGADVVTATKSHLVERWPEVRALAARTGRRIRLGAAVGAALPAADLASRSFLGFDRRAIRGSLNGTSNHVLEALASGESLEAAVARAQALGIAEADPSADLDGRDAAGKLVVLANLLWDLGARISDVEREPIVAATAERALDARSLGLALRSVASASSSAPADAGARLRIRLEAVGPDDPLHGLHGAEKAVVFDLGDAGRVVVSGGRSSPHGAALTMLKDVLGLLTSTG